MWLTESNLGSVNFRSMCPVVFSTGGHDLRGSRRGSPLLCLRVSLLYLQLPALLVFADSCPVDGPALVAIERLSNDFRKTKTKAIIPTNHNRNKQHYEPITVPSNYPQLAQSAGKITRTWCDWFWLYFSLVEKLARVFLANQ